LRLIALTGLIGSGVFIHAQSSSDQVLADLLASEQTRNQAVDAIAASKESKLPLLLSWTRNPPSGVDSYELKIGMADAFGRLKAKEAIPFLIENIGLMRWWNHRHGPGEDNMAAAAALIRIGSDASKAIREIDWDKRKPRDRLAAIFAVSRMIDPEARHFLVEMAEMATWEKDSAQEGIKAIDALPNASIRGRIAGCEFGGRWWARAMPRFDTHLPVREVSVQRDGTFSLSGIANQTRYLILIGKEEQPLKALEANVKLEKDNDIGVIDLAVCLP
jgi:hypothetical protein